jgi:Tetracyclin repressor-like, C-terminal domain
VLVWSCLHGLVSLEIAGNFASMGINPDQVFEAQLGTITLRDPGRPLRIEHGHHLFGVFPDATWRRLIDGSGAGRAGVDDPMRTRTWCSLAGVPPAGNSGGRSRPASSAWPGRTA